MMIERRKHALVLLDALGGEAGRRDFQKLLFLYCRETPLPPYEFVPYRFGAYSFTANSDMEGLVREGHAEADDRHWRVTAAGRKAVSAMGGLRTRAAQFAGRTTRARGDALMAETYRLAPYYAGRSEMAGRLFRDHPAALAEIEAARQPRGPAGLCTIGYEGRTPEAYFNTLIRNGVSLLCDVRRNPLSRKPGFSKKALAGACEGCGLRYEHLPELGIASEERRNLKTQSDYDHLFAGYSRETLPRQGAALDRILAWIRVGERVALTCFEKLPAQCHRHCVGEELRRRTGWPPAHL